MLDRRPTLKSGRAYATTGLSDALLCQHFLLYQIAIFTGGFSFSSSLWSAS